MDAGFPFWSALLAFLIGALISLVELVTTYYPRTYSLFLWNTWAVWAFSAIYGIIAFVIMGAWDFLVQEGLIQSSGFLAKSDVLRPVLIGICAKAFLHIRLFSVEASGKPFPVGIETVVRLFEPWLLKTILLNEHSAVQTFLAEPLRQHTDLAEVKSIIKDNIPATLPREERESVLSDLEKHKKVRAAMAMFLRLYGPEVFRTTFNMDYKKQ